MGMFCYARTLRALLLACGLPLVAPASVLAANLLSPAGAVLIKQSAEPFGIATAILDGGGVHDKWLGLQSRLDDDMVQLALCDGDRERCASPAALQLLAIVDTARARDGRARLGEINRAVNLAIHPASDIVQYGAIDVWASPLATFNHHAGDCEDYAIAKLAALRLAGISADDLRLVIARDTRLGEDHAVATVRLDGHWLTLDNRRMAMVEDSDVRNYRPTFVMGQQGAMKYAYAPAISATVRLSVAQAD
ncbi:signal peptide protein [Bradyrhizobium sp. LTSP885]|uniref:transglutaminase-like cysteine peptidase n=1 Tax=Bradyrhizobium sp. LTSP885 TaxID=1619232 RepID=UPI0005C8D963|nr:transglutaminase-like cysteine peptidase [Bradyrhizobium sp. LTSP885]KJC47759.1 signal peptide protein [Bradyrhizobium sp. LTSP885]